MAAESVGARLSLCSELTFLVPSEAMQATRLTYPKSV